MSKKSKEKEKHAYINKTSIFPTNEIFVDYYQVKQLLKSIISVFIKVRNLKNYFIEFS